MGDMYEKILGILFVAGALPKENGSFDIEHSPNQLDKTTSFPVLIIPGSELDHVSSTNISERYNCGRYVFSFGMADPGIDMLTVRITITLADGLSSIHAPICSVNWDDGNQEDIIIFSTSASRNHTYPESGIHKVIGTCHDNLHPLNDVICPTTNTSCVTTASFFDSFFKDVTTPLKYIVTKPITIKSLLRLNRACKNPVVITWRLTRVVNESFTQDINFTQPKSSVLSLAAQTLEPGEYTVFLEVSHPGEGTKNWIDDFLFMVIVLPELVPVIKGGHLRFVPHGSVIFVNASESIEPVTEIESITDIPLVTIWSFAHFSSKPSSSELSLFQKDFPDPFVLPTSPEPEFHTIYQDNGTELEIDTSMFPTGSWAFVMFSMIKGSRRSSTVQILKFANNAIPVQISCVYNCNKGRERKFNFDKIEFDTEFPDSLIATQFEYSWKLYLWNKPSMSWTETSISTDTGTTSRSVRILKASMVEGDVYRIVVKVSNTNYSPTDVEAYGTVNILPYGGNCTMKNLTGRAARTWFEFTCADWKGIDERRANDTSIDKNPLLTFTATQYTVGALVEEEPVLITSKYFEKFLQVSLKTKCSVATTLFKPGSFESYLILKLGDPTNSYHTTIKVRATDIYNNYKEFELEVTALPAFAWSEVEENEEGRYIITNYTNIDYEADEKELVNMGKVDLIVPLVSSVCSHIHLINLTQWEPPVPRELNTQGAVLDLKAGDNDQVGGYSGIIEETETVLYDPATLALMEVMQNMTNVIRVSTEDYFGNGTSSGDKFLGSTLTNAFTNLAAKPEYVNDDTKGDMIYLSDTVGTKNMEFDKNVTVDDSAQREIVSGEVYNMSQALVNNVVPNDLRQFFHVSDLKNGRTQISDMLSVIGKNISIYNASLSPMERAQIYLTMQYLLQNDLDKKKQNAKDAAKMALKLFKDVQDTINICATCTNVGNQYTEQLVAKNEADVVKNTKYQTKTSNFQVNGIGDLIGDGIGNRSQTVSVSAIEFDEKVFMYDDDQKSSSVTSNILHIDVKLSEDRVNPKSMTFNQSLSSPDAHLYKPIVAPEDASDFSLHSFVYRYNTDFTCIIVKPEDEQNVSSYVLFFRFRYMPTILEYNFISSVSKSSSWKVCISPELMLGYTGLVFIGVQVPDGVQHIRYSFTLVTLGCVTWEEGINRWHTDKCDMEWFEEDNILSCSCRNLTELTFGNTFFAAANTIDFSSVFLKFSPLSQAAVMGAIGGIFTLYVITLLIVIPLDRKDIVKWGITPLRDNLFGDNHYYILKVYTGMRREAGTTSRVGFVLSGDKGDTGRRELSDELGQGFSTGSIRSFFMATTKYLGGLLHLYVWHDNSGSGHLASWYLSRVEVYDIAKQKTYTFVGENWISADTDLDLMIKGTNPGDSLHFDSRFFYQARQGLSESHMWVSIMYRPQASSFTRAQRASCALSYIFLAMIANAMYFNPEDDYESEPGLKAGPFRFNLQQVYISLICALLTTPAIMAIVFLFKQSKPKNSVYESHSNKRQCCGCCKTGYGVENKFGNAGVRNDELQLSSGTPDFNLGFQLPHGCVYIGWFLALVAIVVSAFFILLYSMQWGKQKSEEWLTTFLLSIFESILFVDPIMVILVSLLLACVIRKPDNNLNIDIDRVVEKYKQRQGLRKEGIDYCVDVLRSLIADYRRNKNSFIPISGPIKGEKLREAAREFRHYKRITSVIMDLILNILLITVIAVICYSNRDSRSYKHREYIENQIVDPNYIPNITLSPRFRKIKTHGDVFDWINQTVFPSLFPEKDITGVPLHWTLRENMYGFLNYRLGPPRLRQLRTNTDICDIPYFGTVPCYETYSISEEHTTDYCIGWTDTPCPVYMVRNNASLSAWSFTSALDIWGYPIPGLYSTYGGGGYLATFNVNLNSSIAILNELYAEHWLDRQTRAVFLEFTLYCGSTNMFIYSSFLVEFPDTGGAVTSYSIYPMRLYNHVGPEGVLTLVCEILFLIYTITFFIKLFVKFYQKRCAFYKQFWLIVDCAIFLLATASIVVFFIRLTFTNLTIKKFREDKKEFVNFSHIVLWDQVLVACLGFLTFMATFRVLEILGHTKKVQAVSRIFKKCRGDLVSFGSTFWYIFLGFCILGYCLFGSQLWSYMSVYRTSGTLFLAMLGVSKYSEMNDSHPILAKIFFILYVVCIVFFILSIFLSLLGGTIDEVVQDMRKDKKQDLIDFVMHKIKYLVFEPSMMKKKKKEKSNNFYSQNIETSSVSSDIPHTMTKGTSTGPSLVNLRVPHIKSSD